jgi:lipopolysaccharide/colanic/teichoic acid biosynthesis glycosyltransferase
VLFLQKRIGRGGRTFTIFKFRTMIHLGDEARHPISTRDAQRFTRAGRFLRFWKLDELPQLANVLIGHMSLVGPRPKVPEHVNDYLECRPGITGMASVAFAQEETILLRVPADRLDEYFQHVVLPAKWQMDAEYAERATLLLDIGLLMKSVLRRWETPAAQELLRRFEREGVDDATMMLPEMEDKGSGLGRGDASNKVVVVGLGDLGAVEAAGLE